MDDRPTKRRGPLLWLAGRSRRFWVVTVLALPLLYNLSLPPLFWCSALGMPEGGTFWHTILLAYVKPSEWADEISPRPIERWMNSYVWCLADWFSPSAAPPHEMRDDDDAD